MSCGVNFRASATHGLVAADRALITAEAQYFALQGVEQAMELVEIARDSLNPSLEVRRVLMNLADMRTVHSREALASLRERFDGISCSTASLRSSIAYAESAERARSILDHRPGPRGRLRRPWRANCSSGSARSAATRPRARYSSRSRRTDQASRARRRGQDATPAPGPRCPARVFDRYRSHCA